jgi:hypothetical protein
MTKQEFFPGDSPDEIDEVIERSKDYKSTTLEKGELVYLPPFNRSAGSNFKWIILEAGEDTIRVAPFNDKEMAVNLPREVVIFFQSNFGYLRDKKLEEITSENYFEIISTIAGAIANGYFKEELSIRYVIAHMENFLNLARDLRSLENLDFDQEEI